MFSCRLRSPTIETGQLSRLNQRCRSSKATRCTRTHTHTHIHMRVYTKDETMRGGAINNAWQWLEQREERRIMAIPPMQPLPLARLALIPLSFSATDFYSVTLAGGKFRGLRLEIASRDGPRMHGFYCHFYALHGILTGPSSPRRPLFRIGNLATTSSFIEGATKV